MRESVGYSVTINIISVFIVIAFTFLSAIIIYYKSNRISNVVTNSIEKYEGYNELSEKEIISKMAMLGYSSRAISCSEQKDGCTLFKSLQYSDGHNTKTIEFNYSSGSRGYCVYLCTEGTDYYYFKIRTNMMINVPIVNNILDIPVYSNTNRLYNFEGKLNTNP